MPKLITLEDAGLFQMVCHLDGISHPPGYPLFTMLCNQMVFSSDVISGNFISVIFAILTLIIFYALVFRLFESSSLNHQQVAFIAALSYAFSVTFWSQAIIIEVYSLAVLLFMISWWALLRYRQTSASKFWFLFCLFTGFGLSNHWPLHVLSSAALVFWFISCRIFFVEDIKRPSFLLLSSLCFIVGISPYLSLLYNQNPEIAIYGPVSKDHFLDYILRSYYEDQREGVGFQDKLRYYTWLVSESGLQFGMLAIPFIFHGAFRSWTLLGKLHGATLSFLFLMTTFVLMSLMSIEYDLLYQAIFKPYPIIAYAVLAIWFAIGLVSLPIKSTSRQWVLVILVLVSIPMSNYPKVDRSSSRLIDDYGRLILNSLPENAVLFLRGDNETGPIGYLNRVVGVREDISIYDLDSLVFSNRLTSAFTTKEELDAALKNFLASSKRATFKVSDRSFATTHYGLYSKVAIGPEAVTNWKAEDIRYEFLPEFEQYLEYLLRLHEDDLIHEIHEQLFVYYQLMNFTRQYLGFSMVDTLNAEQVQRFIRLQDTFPGLLVSLEVMIQKNVDPKFILPLVTLLEQKLNKAWPREHAALTYQYFGIVLFRINRFEEAQEKFNKSIEIDSRRANLSFSYLERIAGIHPLSEKPDA